MNFIYLTVDQSLKTYYLTIENSGGGIAGIHENGEGILESILTHIKNDDYYPTIIDKVTHLFHSIVSFHIFIDGNKRIGLTLALNFLITNGYLAIAKKFMEEMENICIHVAAGKIDKPLLKRIVYSVMNEAEFDQELKLDYIMALSEEKT